MKVKNEYYSKGELNALAEMLMMGFVKQFTDEDNIKYVIDYVSKTLGKDITADEIYEKAYEFISDKDKTKVVGLSVNTLYGEMQCLTLIFKDEGEPFNIEDENGVFCYCYNYTYPDCSELGYSFFKREHGKLHRIG